MARPRRDSAAAAAAGKGSKSHHHRKTDGGDKPKVSYEVREKRVSRGSTSRSPEKRAPNKSSATSQTSSHILSIDSLAKLDAENEKSGARQKEKEKKVGKGGGGKERGKHGRRKRRVVSGALLEEGRGGHPGRGRRGGYLPTEGQRRKYGRCFWVVVGVVVLLLVILIPVGVLVVGKNGGSGGGSNGSGAAPSNSNLNSISPNDIPVSWLGLVGLSDWTLTGFESLRRREVFSTRSCGTIRPTLMLLIRMCWLVGSLSWVSIPNTTIRPKQTVKRPR